MCVLAIWLGMDPKHPLIVAANRDEAYARPSAPPAELEPGLFAGKDLVAGGTWLGINAHGLFVAVTNRSTPPRRDDSLSRGRLALEALNCRKLGCLEALVERRVSDHPVAGFNLVAAVDGEGLCLHWDGALRRAPLSKGVHVVSSDRDADAPGLPERVALDAMIPGLPDEDSLKRFLGSHDGERPVCKHGDHYGTVSSTILFDGDGGPSLLHAEGPPCRSPFRKLR